MSYHRLVKVLPFLLLAACAVDHPVAGPTVLTPVPATAEWTAHVNAAAAEWNAWCPGTFVVADAGHTVQLVHTADWPRPDGSLGEFVTNTAPWSIIVREGRLWAPTQRTLLHELGHSLGLDHVFGRESIMNERSGPTITAEDADAACNN